MRVLIALLLCLSAPTIGSAKTILHDEGGPMFAYYLKAAMLHDKGEDVVIDGLCASACTVYLELACATSRARIGFHRPRYSKQIRKKLQRDKINIQQFEQREAMRLLSTYPPAVKDWLKKRGGLTTKVLWLTGMDAVELLGEC